MQARTGILAWNDAACLQIGDDGILVEAVQPDGKMVHALRTITAPDRQMTRAEFELNELGGFALALNWQAEDVAIKLHGALKIAHSDGHVVERAALEPGSR